MGIVESVRGEFVRYRALAEAAIGQVTDEQLAAAGAAGSNSIAVICRHVSGNLRSRFTDFLTSDGEKPWRRRDEEFEPPTISREDLLSQWRQGWDVLFESLDAMSDAQLTATVTIRGQPFPAHEALFRALAHVSYHVGQIVYIAKSLRGADWSSLSIPTGQSDAFNQRRPDQSPAAQASAISSLAANRASSS
jgi:hypothetical protein